MIEKIPPKAHVMYVIQQCETSTQLNILLYKTPACSCQHWPSDVPHPRHGQMFPSALTRWWSCVIFRRNESVAGVPHFLLQTQTGCRVSVTFCQTCEMSTLLFYTRWIMETFILTGNVHSATRWWDELLIKPNERTAPFLMFHFIWLGMFISFISAETWK